MGTLVSRQLQLCKAVILFPDLADAEGHGEPGQGTDVSHGQAALRQHGELATTTLLVPREADLAAGGVS